jgi:hypothetical protein
MAAFSTPPQPQILSPDIQPAVTGCRIVDDPVVYSRSGGYFVLFGDGRRPSFVYKGQVDPNDPRHDEALGAVQRYLDDGGEPVEEHRSNFWMVAPWECPLCGKPAKPDLRWNSAWRGAGWQCTGRQRLGEGHYWTFMINCLRDHVRGDPELIPGVD